MKLKGFFILFALLSAICLNGQEIFRLSSEYGSMPYSRKEFYSFYANGEFTYTLRVKGLSIALENRGFWKYQSPDSILLSSAINLSSQSIPLKKDSIMFFKPSHTFEIANKCGKNNTKGIKFEIEGFKNYQPNFSLVYFVNGLRTKIDTIRKDITVHEEKIDSFYLVDMNTGVASENYTGVKKAFLYSCKQITTRIFCNEYLVKNQDDMWFSPTNIIDKYFGISTLKFRKGQ